MQIFNARTQQVEEATMSVDGNNDIVATFADETIVKFPAGLDQAQLDELIAEHQEANEGQVIITPEMEAEVAAQREASLKLIGDTTPESQSNDSPTEIPATVEG